MLGSGQLPPLGGSFKLDIELPSGAFLPFYKFVQTYEAAFSFQLAAEGSYTITPSFVTSDTNYRDIGSKALQFDVTSIAPSLVTFLGKTKGGATSIELVFNEPLKPSATDPNDYSFSTVKKKVIHGKKKSVSVPLAIKGITLVNNGSTVMVSLKKRFKGTVVFTINRTIYATNGDVAEPLRSRLFPQGPLRSKCQRASLSDSLVTLFTTLIACFVVTMIISLLHTRNHH